MKNLFVTILLVSFAVILKAQNMNFFGFKVKKVDFIVGVDFDRSSNFDPTFFTDQLSYDSSFLSEEINFDKPELFDAFFEDPQFRFGITLEIPNHPRLEWRNAFNFTPRREDKLTYDGISYSDYIIMNGTSQGYQLVSLNLLQYQSEFALESVILYTLINKNIFKVYTGIGSNAGYTFWNHVNVWGSNADQINGVSVNDGNDNNQFTDHFNLSFPDGPNEFNSRLFAQIGTSIILFERIELGVNVKRGIGYTISKELPTKFTNLVSAGLSVRFILKQPKLTKVKEIKEEDIREELDTTMGYSSFSSPIKSL